MSAAGITKHPAILPCRADGASAFCRDGRRAHEPRRPGCWGYRMAQRLFSARRELDRLLGSPLGPAGELVTTVEPGDSGSLRRLPFPDLPRQRGKHLELGADRLGAGSAASSYADPPRLRARRPAGLNGSGQSYDLARLSRRIMRSDLSRLVFARRDRGITERQRRESEFEPVDPPL